MLRVETIGQLFAAAKALSSLHYRGASERLVIITNGGGPGVMAADRATDQGIELSELSAETMKALDAVLPGVPKYIKPPGLSADDIEIWFVEPETTRRVPGVDRGLAR